MRTAEQSKAAEARFAYALALLPADMRQAVLSLRESERAQIEEFRLRSGRSFTVLLPDGEKVPGRSEEGIRVLTDDLTTVVERASESSIYAAREAIRSGYLPAAGGHRVGVCGSVAGDMLRSYSSVCIRVAREIVGAADGVAASLVEGGRLQNTLILSPPGGGKTTLLRDLIRQLSDKARLRVSVADERSELAACYRGIPQFDIGCRTDVLDSCPKAEGMLMLLRSMSPEVIAVDEITAPADLAAVGTLCGCGVSVVATAHAADLSELAERPLYRTLLAQGIFKKAVLIRRNGRKREAEVSEL